MTPKWPVETEIHILSKSNTLYDNRRANSGENAMRFSKNILTKIEIARPPVVRSASKQSQVGFDMYRFGWCAREVQENSVARDWLRPRFWKCAPFSRKLRSLDDFPTFRTLSISMDRECSEWRSAVLECTYGVIECRRVPRSDYGGLSGSRTNWKTLLFHEIFTFLENFQAPSRQFLGCKQCHIASETTQEWLRSCFEGKGIHIEKLHNF